MMNSTNMNLPQASLKSKFVYCVAYSHYEPEFFAITQLSIQDSPQGNAFVKKIFAITMHKLLHFNPFI